MKAVVVCTDPKCARPEYELSVKGVSDAERYTQEHNSLNPGHRANVQIQGTSPSGKVIAIPKPRERWV